MSCFHNKKDNRSYRINQKAKEIPFNKTYILNKQLHMLFQPVKMKPKLATSQDGLRGEPWG